MDTIEPARFTDGPEMLLAGIRRHHRFLGAPDGMTGQWGEFHSMLPIPGQKGRVGYGVMCGSTPESFEYMCAVEVGSFDELPQETGRMRVPPQHYAVFLHEGHVSTLRETWEAILRDWLPDSEYTSAPTPDFERYDERFDPATQSGVIEIWFPVVSKS